MKTLIISSLAVLFCFTVSAQEKNVETESTSVDELITFIVEHYSIEKDSTKTKNIVFLIETYSDNINVEDSVILKQAFRLLSKRLNDTDKISFVAYSNFNGLMLSQVAATDLKKILYAVEHPKTSISEFKKDGITLAYELIQTNYVEGSENTVIMIRMPGRKSEVVETEVNLKYDSTKKKGNAVILTAISLLPELISVIKE